MPDRDFAGSRVLVLGEGNSAAQARGLLAAAGAVLERSFNASVTFVVVDRTVPSGHNDVSRAVAASIPVLTTAQLRERMGISNGGTGPYRAGSSQGRQPAVPAPVPTPAAYRAPVPSSSPHWASAGQRATAWGLVAGAVVVGTGGFAAGPVIGFVAWRQRALNQWPLVAGYTGSAALVVAGLSYGFPFLFVSVMLLLVNMIVGGVHAFHATEKLMRKVERAKLPDPAEARNRMAIAQVDSRRRLRESSRRIATEDPTKARELRIGRPDLRRAYDDGGLIDINAVPVTYLMTIPGMTREVAGQIIEWREEKGPFHSTAELVVHTNLTAKAAEQIDEYALYLE